MVSAREAFDRDGYVLLADMVSADECAALVQRLGGLNEAGRMISDEQCPRSRAIYGDPALDELLARLIEPLSQALGRTLLPTYSYARIYLPGETLKRHVDRAACEISATMTLGFDAPRVWPIFFAKDRFDFLGTSIDIPIGGLAAYKGCVMPHWRERFEGVWQAQVFLHYVDAAGPYVAEHLDRRESLGTHAAARTNARTS